MWLRVGVAAFLAAMTICGTLAVILVGLDARGDVGPVGGDLARQASATAAGLVIADRATARQVLRDVPGAGRIYSADGRLLTQSGPPAIWRAGQRGRLSRLATAGTDGWRALAGALEASGRTPGGGRLVMRQPLTPGQGEVTTGAVAGALGLALLAALGVAGLAALAAATAARRLDRAATSIAALTTGRPPRLGAGPEWRRLDAAIADARRHLVNLNRAADARFDGVGAALTPAALPIALRTPAGARVRNPALQRLLDSLGKPDAAALDDAVRAALGGAGAVARAVDLADGRRLDIEAWPVPGGRLVSVVDRTEQERLRELRGRLTSAATRSLAGPVADIRRCANELFHRLPVGTEGPRLARLLTAADRLDRHVTRLLAGSEDAGRGRPRVQRELGTAGLLHGLARRWDVRLRPRSLRIELVLGTDLPAVRTDPAMIAQILDELVDNAAKFGPRGGAIVMSARGEAGWLVLEVRDDGRGVRPSEIAEVTIPFVRGRDAAAMPGAGLGLGVAAALAERIGARLELSAGPGGSVRLEVPPAPAGAVPAARAA